MLSLREDASYGKESQVNVIDSDVMGENIDLDSLTDEQFKTLKENSSDNIKLSRLIEDGMLQPEELLNLSRKEIRNVMHSTIYCLMECNALNPKDALAFSDRQYEIFSSICIASKIRGFANIIDKLQTLTDHQIKVMKSPNIAWLLLWKTIKPEEILLLPEYLLTAFDELNFSQKEFYGDELDTLVTHVKFFMSYFLKKLLPPKELFSLEEDKWTNVKINLEEPRIAGFLTSGAIAWDYLTVIAPILLIQSLPNNIVELINKKTINLSDELARRSHIIQSRNLNLAEIFAPDDYASDTDAMKVMNFIKIYTAMQIGQSSFFKKSDWVKANKIAELAPATALKMITEHAEDRSTRTHAAWALCTTLSNDPHALEKNVYLYAFKKSHLFKKSNVFGQTFYRASALQKYLENNPQQMPSEAGDNTRMNKILHTLR